MKSIAFAILMAMALLTGPAMAQSDDPYCGEGPTFDKTVEMIKSAEEPGQYLVLEGKALAVFVSAINAAFGMGEPPDGFLEGKVLIPAEAEEDGMHPIFNFSATGCASTLGNGRIPNVMVATGLVAVVEALGDIPELN